MKILKLLGLITYTAILNIAIHIFFCWITPYFMSLSWLWFFVAAGLGGGILGYVIDKLFKLIFYLSPKTKISKIMPTIFCVICCFLSLKALWITTDGFGILQWILALSLTSAILGTYLVELYVLWVFDEFIE